MVHFHFPTQHDESTSQEVLAVGEKSSAIRANLGQVMRAFSHCETPLSMRRAMIVSTPLFRVGGLLRILGV